jgi:sulfatase modifying factor 1
VTRARTSWWPGAGWRRRALAGGLTLAAGVTSPPARAERTAPSCDGRPGAGLDCAGVSCCTRLAVPGGSFDLGKGKVTVAPFALDEFEATVGRFEAWLAAGRPLPAPGTVVSRPKNAAPVTWTAALDPEVQTRATLAGWHKYDTFGAGHATAPKNSVSFYTAMAFCAFDGGRLPTDEEWIYAAVGGDEGRTHPWGEALPTFDHAVYNCAGDGDPSCDLADLLPVGSKPKGRGRWGHMDLAGSVFEWTTSGAMRHLFIEEARSRGGGFCYIGGVDRRAPEGLRADTYRVDPPTQISHTVGVRCAYDVETTSTTKR